MGRADDRRDHGYAAGRLAGTHHSQSHRGAHQHRARVGRLGAVANDTASHLEGHLGEAAVGDAHACIAVVRDAAWLSGDGLHRTRLPSGSGARRGLPGLYGRVRDACQCGRGQLVSSHRGGDCGRIRHVVDRVSGTALDLVGPRCPVWSTDGRGGAGHQSGGGCVFGNPPAGFRGLRPDSRKLAVHGFGFSSQFVAHVRSDLPHLAAGLMLEVPTLNSIRLSSSTVMLHRQLSVFWILVALTSLAATASNLAADGIQTEFEMYHDPDLPQPVVVLRLDERLLPLWRQVLVRPEADHQRLAAEAIAYAADQGFPDLEPAIDDLHAVLTSPASHPAARYAAARALIALDVRSSSDAMFEMSQQHGSQLRLLVEPAFAAWGYEAILPVWRERVRDSNTNRSELLLAFDGLRQLQDADALDAMLAIVRSASRPPGVRLAAAQTCGAASIGGLEPEVTFLLALESPQVLHRLCAVALLQRHGSEEARIQLATLGQDLEPTVAEQALGYLYAIDPELVIPLAAEAMQNEDPKVRRRGADAYVALATPDRAIALCQLLDDVHPEIRGSIRDDLLLLAERPELDDAIRDNALDVLSRESWRGQEQAALLLGALDHKPSASRLIELLKSTRPEVMIASAWSLRMLAVPETLPEILAHARHQSTERLAGRGTEGLDEQVAHLFEAMTLMDYAPCEELLREYVPKVFANGYYSRGAAIWGLGHFHKGTPDEELAAQLVERMNDIASMPPDLDIVFRMSALSLGRMQAESQLPALRERLGSSQGLDPVSCAIRWSLHEITGEEFIDPGPQVQGRSGWFLESLIVDPNTDP